MEITPNDALHNWQCYFSASYEGMTRMCQAEEMN